MTGKTTNSRISRKPQSRPAGAHPRQKAARKPRPRGPRKIILFNKPFDVLPQFTDEAGRSTLKDYIPVTDVYAAGRLDRDSEGLLILTNDGALQATLTQPENKAPKVYYAQVEGVPDENALNQLRNGITLNDGPTRPAGAELVDEPEWLWPRNPPIRERKSVPVSWLKLTLREGRNRQVRRMTAHTGHPTLRLIRVRIGDFALDTLTPGEWREVNDIQTSCDSGLPGQRR